MNSSRPEYPADEHVYSFPLRTGGYDAAQLIYRLEDVLDLLLSQYEGQEQTQGWATIDNLKPRLDLRMFEPLSSEQLAVVAQVVEDHRITPRGYGGRFRSVVTRYKNTVGQVLVRHSITGEESFASGFIFAQSDSCVTAGHVVKPPWQLSGVAFDDGHRSEATVVQRDDGFDLALIRLVNPPWAPLLRVRRPLALPDDLSRPCIVMGFPNVPGASPQLSIEEVRLAAMRTVYLTGQELIELSTDLQGGYSGGPVLTAGHSVAGVVIGYPSAERSSDAAQADRRGRAVCLPESALRRWWHAVNQV